MSAVDDNDGRREWERRQAGVLGIREDHYFLGSLSGSQHTECPSEPEGTKVH